MRHPATNRFKNPNHPQRTKKNLVMTNRYLRLVAAVLRTCP